MNVRWQFKGSQYDDWRTFYKTAQNNGTDLMTLELVVRGDTRTQHLCRIMPGTAQLAGVEGETFTVSARIEVDTVNVFQEYTPPAGGDQLQVPWFQLIRQGTITQALSNNYYPTKSATFIGDGNFNQSGTGIEWGVGSQYNVVDTLGQEGIETDHVGASWPRLRYANSNARALARLIYPRDMFTVMTIWIRNGTYNAGRSGILFSAPQQTGNQSTFDLSISQTTGLHTSLRNGASRPAYTLREHTGSGPDYRGESHMYSLVISPSSAQGTPDGQVYLFVDGQEVAADTTTWEEDNFVASANDERLSLGKRNQATQEDNADGINQMINFYYIPTNLVPTNWRADILENNFNFWNTTEFNY